MSGSILQIQIASLDVSHEIKTGHRTPYCVSEDLALKNGLTNGVRKNNGPKRIRDQFCLSAKNASSDGPQGPN